MSDAFFQRFVAPCVCARSVCPAEKERESRKIVFFISISSKCSIRVPWEPVMPFGLLDRHSPSIHSAERARKVISTRFFAIFARTCTGNIHEIGQSMACTDGNVEKNKQWISRSYNAGWLIWKLYLWFFRNIFYQKRKYSFLNYFNRYQKYYFKNYNICTKSMILFQLSQNLLQFTQKYFKSLLQIDRLTRERRDRFFESECS